MRFIVIGALLLGGLAFGVVLKKFVWPAIKADPVANLILHYIFCLCQRVNKYHLEYKILQNLVAEDSFRK